MFDDTKFECMLRLKLFREKHGKIKLYTQKDMVKKTFQIGGLKQLFKKRCTTKYYTKVRKGLCV